LFLLEYGSVEKHIPVPPGSKGETSVDLSNTLNQTLQERRIRHATSKKYFHIWESIQRVPKGKIKNKKKKVKCVHFLLVKLLLAMRYSN